MSPSPVTIFFHNYYGSHNKWIRFFCERLNYPFHLFYNIVADSIYNLDCDLESLNSLRKDVSGGSLMKLVLRKSPNQGKDIGGKLVLLDAWLRLQMETEWVVFLHDKMSPHKIQNQEWQRKLFRIIEPPFVKRAIDLFTNRQDVGIVASAENIRNEYDYNRQTFASNSAPQLKKLLPEYNIATTNYSYVAGTMFWVRSVPLSNFFRLYNPLDIRKNLEKGNVMDEANGSNTHAWERLLCWLVMAQGYELKGLT